MYYGKRKLQLLQLESYWRSSCTLYTDICNDQKGTVWLYTSISDISTELPLSLSPYNLERYIQTHERMKKNFFFPLLRPPICPLRKKRQDRGNNIGNGKLLGHAELCFFFQVAVWQTFRCSNCNFLPRMCSTAHWKHLWGSLFGVCLRIDMLLWIRCSLAISILKY